MDGPLSKLKLEMDILERASGGYTSADKSSMLNFWEIDVNLERIEMQVRSFLRHLVPLSALALLLACHSNDGSVAGEETPPLVDPDPIPGARAWHSATLLDDGRVMVSGGIEYIFNPSGQTYNLYDDAWTYDPNDGSWTSAGSLAHWRYGHLSFLLPDGDVLLIHGAVPTPPLSNNWPLERFNTQSASWIPWFQDSMWEITLLAGTLLPSGEVFFCGGYVSSGAVWFDYVSKDSSVYSPNPESIQFSGEMSLGRFQHTASLLPDGRVLVVSGADESCEIWDPGTSSFSLTDSLTTARGRHTATVLADGRVLVAGGFAGVSVVAETYQIFDPTTESWTPEANMSDPRVYHVATLLPDATVLICGGTNWSDGRKPTKATLIYDAVTDAWSGGPSLMDARNFPTAILLGDNTVLIVGGNANDGSPFDSSLDSVELLGPFPP